MRRYPELEKLLKAMSKLGFETVRVRGNHYLLRHADGRTTIVPVYPDEAISSGLLRKILADCKITPDELQDLL